MKTIIYLSIISLLIACGTEKETTTSEVASQGQFAQKATDRPLPGKTLLNHPTLSIDNRLPNGLIAKVGAAGDTIGFQTYLNGVKHGPFFDALGSEFAQRKDEKKPDGFFINGKKDGYFKRYRGPKDPQYVSYYEAGEFLWAGWYSWGEMGIYPQEPFHLEKKDSVCVEAPHVNGRTWFKGLYVDGKPKGVHKFYYPDGKKSGEINYYTKTVTEIWGDDSEDRNSYTFEEDDMWFASKN